MQLEKSRQFFGYALIALLVLFAVYSNVRLGIQNYHLRVRIAEAKAETEQMRSRNERISLVLSYYQTAAYQDIEARRRLGLKRPEETVLTVKNLGLSNDQLNLLEDAVYQQETPAPTVPRTNLQNWHQYLFGKKS